MDLKRKYWILNKVSASVVEVLIYGEIGWEVSASYFVRELKALEKDYKQINVRINSAGGSVFEGIAIYNAMRASSATVETYVDGLAASMGSIIALAGSKVHMSMNASIMTHKPSIGGGGDSEELKRKAQLLDDLEATMAGIYAAKTGKTEQECKTAYLNGKDNWFTATQALEHGLVDTLFDLASVKKPAAQLDEHQAYAHYAGQLTYPAPKEPAQKDNTNMEGVQFTPEMVAQLGLKPDASAADITAALKVLAERVAEANTLQTALDTATAASVQAVADLTAYKKTQESEKINALLDQANKEGRISVNQKVKLAAKYADDYDGLKELVDTMQVQPLVTDGIEGNLTAAEQAEVTELMRVPGGELFVKNKFERLRKLSPDGFKKKWKDYTGRDAEV